MFLSTLGLILIIPYGFAFMDHLIFKRESAFDLLRLESEFDAMVKEKQRLNARSIGLWDVQKNPSSESFYLKTTFLVGVQMSEEEQCQKQCNDKLKISLDMVKVGMNF
jgi:hypothetical protein